MHRKILDWEWFTHVPTRLVFEWFLYMAAWKDMVSENGYPLQAGQLYTTRDEIAKVNGLTDRQVRTAISHLISTHEITVESTKNGRLITILKYSEYQGENQKRPTKRPTKTEKTTKTTTNKNSSPTYTETSKLPYDYTSKEETQKSKTTKPPTNSRAKNDQANDQLYIRIKKNKKEKEIKKKKEFAFVISLFNFFLGKTFTTKNDLFPYYEHWSSIYPLERIATAIAKIKYHDFWGTKMTPTIFFRKRGTNQEPVDRIEDMLTFRVPSESTELCKLDIEKAREKTANFLQEDSE